MAQSNQNEEIGARKPITPVEYMQEKYSAVEFTFTFEKWHVWTEMAGENRYRMAGSFNRTRLDLVKEIIQTRKMHKRKGLTSALVSETVMGMMVLEGKGGTVPGGSFPSPPQLTLQTGTDWKTKRHLLKLFLQAHHSLQLPHSYISHTCEPGARRVCAFHHSTLW